ncbi:CPBP family intramembrane glutamic endopeptidase [Parvularcula sp. LCG005]|uniref:CPBP family intramembrane glutamic endopeptidase n=1 Tax=Parvularcula sp. LCG005 TaxID=3078805 RepID=UPI0029426EBF|nr:CPBP family intramembrane glutamic endopeptidase [Parvularcula sp. LCG005]WOI53413.1 CPBP family intramembrane glutamic endopeptidase [Parvularcula sp. LCG005]
MSDEDVPKKVHPVQALAVALVGQFAFIGVALFIHDVTEVDLVGALGFVPLDLLWGLLGATALIGLALMLRRALPGVSRDLDKLIDDMLNQAGLSLTPLTILILSAAAGFAEELLFRGALQGWLMGHLPVAAAIALPTLLFAALHLYSVTYMLIILPVGLALGLLYWATGSLWGVIIAHTLYDVFAFSFARWRHSRVGK